MAQHWSTKQDEMIYYGGGMPSANGIAAAFPHKILEKINRTPSCIDKDDAKEKHTEMRLQFRQWTLE